MARLLRTILIALGGIVGLVAVVIGALFIYFWYHNAFKSEVQTLAVPRWQVEYVLMTDISGFEDPAWYVYEISLGAARPKTIRTGGDHSEAIFWNYDEANELTENPQLEVIAGRYLLFSRGGLNFSLYDIDSRKVLVNDESPWTSYYQEAGDEAFAMSSQGQWVSENLDRKIRHLLETSNASLEHPPEE